ncbi:MAG TPA: DUF4082 domain-containing protein [Solirubrobacteraceae bacterium]|nr:DUF4082 domain-containing protein [Solirubrobacteraceae bacterium]
MVPSSAIAAACDPPVTNPIACENTKTGTPPAVWTIDGAGDQSLQGFATSMSVNKGQTVDFKIKSTTTASYKIDIYRVGYYGGDGARLIAGNLSPTGSSTQSACLTQAGTGLVDCGNWTVSRSWTVPADAVSGVYVARLTRTANPTAASHITFVVRDDAAGSDVLLQTSDATWQAYNTYGGNSLYQCNLACPTTDPLGYKGAYKVSYNRPFHSAEDDVGGRSFLWWSEYPMIRFLERSGYNLSYTTNLDAHLRPSTLLGHKLFVASGHDEYWSQTQRTNVEAARDAGVNLAFFTGNEIFWKTRWEPSIASGAAANRTLVSYKDTHFAQQEDPVEWTGTWRDPRYTTPPNRPVPENALTGQTFLVNAGTADITVPFAFKNLRLWRDTSVSNLTPSSNPVKLGTSTLGYEWDEDADNGFRPAGQFKLSSTTVSGVERFLDYGSTVAVGTATHNLTSHRAPSGALVFGAGTVQWAWGLDDANALGTPPDRNMQQATLNLFADMGAQPDTVLPTLVRATKSTDATKPTSSVTSPTGAGVADGARITVSGTAADAGGGVVAGVEVSTDGGVTWHPATGTTNWTYSWIAHGTPSTTIKSRAVDDSANIESPGAGVAVAVAVSCPCSIWGTQHTPAVIDAGDPGAIEVGVKFKSDVFGTVSGIRFYKSAANTGTHSGSLWAADGTRLAQATFTGESASGWQTVMFSSPVDVQPNTTYVASYFAPNGHYAGDAAYLYPQPAPGPNGGAITDAGPLHALINTGATQNGVYLYNPTSAFPTSTFAASNYWVDVLFAPIPAPGQVTNVVAAAGGRTSANITWTAPSTGGTPTQYRITPFRGLAAQPPTTVAAPATSGAVTGLLNGQAYTFTVAAINPTGSGVPSTQSNAVTPLDPVAPTAPASVTAKPASQSALVAWAAPISDGDSAITGYTITPYLGATPLVPTNVGAASTSATLTGLQNGASYAFTVRATNTIGTSPQSAASTPITPQGAIFDFATPSVVDAGDANAVELGVKFTADVSGSVTGVRFYKAVANTGTHVGSLWSIGGTRLAQATFLNESASGWQTVTFSSPVPVTAGTSYVASYFTPSGHYSVTGGGLAAGAGNPPLHAIANTTSANGVYAYSATSTFPANTYNAGNYYVDVMFAVPIPGQALNATAQAGGRTSAVVFWSAPSSGGPATSYRITPYVGASAKPATTITGVPLPTSATVSGLTNGETYTFTVSAVNASGAGAESAHSNQATPLNAVAPAAPSGVVARPASKSVEVSWNVPGGDGDSQITGYVVTPFVGANAQAPVNVGPSSTSTTVTALTNGTTYTFNVRATNAIGTSVASGPSGAVTPQDTIFDFSVPGTPDSGDGNPIEAGAKFRTDFAGSITGVRFYKSTANVGTHTGSLWSAAGARIAQATFTNETSSGWQSVTFAAPVAVAAGTTYIVSYFAPNGHYAATSGGLTNAVDNPPVHTVASSSSANGVFAYGATSSFPANSYQAGNYWVDVLFAMPVPGAPTSVTATAGTGSAQVTWTAPSTGTAASYKITPYVGAAAQTPKTITGSPPATSTTVNGLTPGTSYTFRVTASSTSGPGPQSAPSNAVTPLALTAPTAPSAVTAAADSKSAIVTWTPPASDGGSPLTGQRVTPYVGAIPQPAVDVAASDTRVRVTGLTNATSYTFRVTATNVIGDSVASAASNAVAPRHSILDLGTPATVDSGDSSAIELGVKFQPDLDGQITGIRFYKAAANTGTHIASLWKTDGSRLAQATFTNESASGWQTVAFSSPVAVTAGTTYVASYFTPNGHYSLSSEAFADQVVNAPLRTIGDGTSPNGVFLYTGATAFPQLSFNATNYWVDVLFAPSS